MDRLSQTTTGYACDEVEAPRTFEGISDAVGRVRISRYQVERMLDRVGPTPAPASIKANGDKNEARPSYLGAITSLQSELTELGHALDALERHV